MKKFYLRLLIAVSLFTGGISLTACSGDDNNEVETVILVKDLPAEAQTFLSSYYSGVKATRIEKEYIKDIVMYDVNLEDGTEIMFNSEGVWQEVDAPEGKSVPNGFYPSGIDDYVNQNFPDYGINEINKTGEGFNVELVTGEYQLIFDPEGNYIRTIDEL